jgi:predicted GNAT family acetyltransferase
MNIVHDADAHKFTVNDDNGRQMGEIDYRPDEGNRIIATHTRVNEQFRGRGIADQLLDALVAYAEQNDLKIVPLCSFVVAAFEKKPRKYLRVMADG